MKKCFLLFLVFFWSNWAVAVPLPADRAFVLTASLDQSHQVLLRWNIAPGYFLYRSRLSIRPLTQQTLLPVQFPKGIFHQDPVHGVDQVYANSLEIPIFFKNAQKPLLALEIRYQGCSKAGFCYTPIRKILQVDLSKVTAPANLTTFIAAPEIAKIPPDPSARFFAKGLIWVVCGFFGLGMLLSLTPCILPMVPILSAIIVGKNSRPFLLSLSYVMGMAMTYALIGLMIALVGRNLQTVLQQPWVIILFSMIFVALALSLFGLYALQLPKTWQKKLGQLTGRQQGGTFLGVFVMGGLSTLIVSPCVSAPLVGVLTFIGKTGDIGLGMLALFSLGLGMGMPLLCIGLSARHLLPRSGPWMIGLQRLFGVILFAMAIWLMLRVVPGPRPALNNLFTLIHSPAELTSALQQAKLTKQPVFIDFYADWCSACVLMDKTLFTEATIQKALHRFVRLRIDLTQDSLADRQMLRQFQQIGPPAMLFFNCDGQWLAHFSLVGESTRSMLLSRLQQTRQTALCQKQ